MIHDRRFDLQGFLVDSSAMHDLTLVDQSRNPCEVLFIDDLSVGIVL